MILCRDKGCDLNYCGLIKKSVPMEWEGSSDCTNEYKLFTDCMKLERRRWVYGKPEGVTMYDYIQQELGRKREE